MSVDKKAWKPNNKRWLEKRNKEWEKVRIRLPGIPGIKREQWAIVEDHFFTGTELPKADMAYHWEYKLILQWWLHPVGVDFVQCFRNVRGIRSYFQYFCSDLRDVVLAKGGDAEYGLMGGREQEIALFLHRGWDPRIECDFGGGVIAPQSSSCRWLFGHWLSAVEEEMKAENYIAHSFALAFYDHIMDMMEELPQAPFEHKIEIAVSKKGLDIRHDRLSRLIDVVPKLMTFFERDPNDPALNRPYTVEYIDRIVSGYKNKTLPRGMIDVIDYTYAHIENEEKKRFAKNARSRELRRQKAELNLKSKKKGSKKKAQKKAVSATNTSAASKKRIKMSTASKKTTTSKKKKLKSNDE